MAQRYLTLDAARGVAALAVFAFHVGISLGVPVLPGAYLAVDFFFLLSGFVIAGAYEQRLSEGLTLPDFAWIRFKRLFPLYLAGTALAVIGALPRFLHGDPEPQAQMLARIGTISAALVMLPGRIPGSDLVYPLNFPAWSLGFELIANFAYAAATAVRRMSRWALAVVIGASLTGLIWTVATTGTFELGPEWHDGWGGYLRVGFSFFAGVLIWRVRRDRPLVASNWAALACLAALGLLLALAPAAGFGPLVIVAIAFPALLFVSACIQPTGRFAALAKQAGELSYALYAIHAPLIGAVLVVLKSRHLPLPLSGALVVSSCLVGAWIAHRFWDLPVRRWSAGRKLRRLENA
ncbi:MAG: acyltransferase [Caulobacteraceae bacterium]